eukprot:gene21369-6111_t
MAKADLRAPGALGGSAEWSKIKRSFHRQFKRSLKLHDPKHMQWRTVVQREVDKLYHSMQSMVSGGLTDPEFENPEEAIFGVLCLLGDCVLADKWLSQWSKMIRFDFQLMNFCERISEWLESLKKDDCDACFFKPTTLAGLSSCLLESVCAERLERCTVLHLAAMSGDHNMVIAVTTIWDEVVRDMLNTARQQLLRRPDDEDVLRRVEELENEWRQRNTLGESPYDMVPECQTIGGSTY